MEICLKKFFALHLCVSFSQVFNNDFIVRTQFMHIIGSSTVIGYIIESTSFCSL